MPRLPFTAVVVIALVVFGATVPGAVASEASLEALQDEHLADRPVSSITFKGLGRVSEQKIWNNIRSRVGGPYDPKTARDDVELLTRLGDFNNVDIEATLEDDGTVSLVYVFDEQQQLSEVQVVGNRVLTDQVLLGPIGLRRGSPRDDFVIERGIREIQDLYQEKGYYLTEVSVDQNQLEENGLLIFEVVEGPRVRVRAIEFEGNVTVPDKRLYSEIKTRTWFPFFRRGELDTDLLKRDVSTLDSYYKDRGYLDARVDKTIEISPDQREAKVIFLVEEGPEFTVGQITSSTRFEDESLEVFSTGQLKALMELKSGDRYMADIRRRSEAQLKAAYGTLGYLDASVSLLPVHSSSANEVNIIIEISE